MKVVESNGKTPLQLQPGWNCWRLVPADRVAFLIEGAAYFAAVREAFKHARHSIFILGWDIDSRLQLIREASADGLPVELGPFLDAIVRLGLLLDWTPMEAWLEVVLQHSRQRLKQRSGEKNN